MVLPVWLFWVGLNAYVSLYVMPRCSGDLGDLALIPFGKDYNKLISMEEMSDTLYTTFHDEDEVRKGKADVLTVGDSFSQFGNTGYQNYMQAKGVDVVNYARHFMFNPIQKATDLLRFGYVDSTNVKVLVIEVAERLVVEHFRKLKFDNELLIHDLPKTTINDNGKWSLTRTRDYIYYRLNIGGINPVRSCRLKRDLFSSDEPQKLYFYIDEIKLEMAITEQDGQMIKNKFDILMGIANEKGVELLFVMPPDKYDLYQDDIMDNPYPPKTINEDMMRFLGEYKSILLLKPTLKPLIERGVKDVYLFNDTHWSYKAQQVVADEILHKIEDLGIVTH